MAPTNRKAEADTTLAPTYTSNATTPPSHIPGRDSVRQLDETTGKSPLTDRLALGVAEKSIVTTPNYSKRLQVSGSTPNSHLCEFF